MPIVPYPSSAFEKLMKTSQEIPETIRKSVSDILKQVRQDGDAALIKFSKKFDRVSLKASDLRIPSALIQKARVTRELEQAGRDTFKQVTAFAKASWPCAWSIKNGHGAVVGEKFDALSRVGIYVPGGSVPLVSTVFMTALLAKIAGVKEIVVCTPPPIHPSLLWAFKICGVTEVFQIGGAQAIGAMAFGTRTIRPVDKIFGPGNVYVTEAKRQVFGSVGIDLLAGPSEVMVLVDETTPAHWVAADLLAQAEHGSGRERVFCVSTSARALKQTLEKIKSITAPQRVSRGMEKVLKDGLWMIHAKNQKQMAEIANRIAPEHLQIMTKSPRAWIPLIKTAGAIFIGNQTPTVLGDFVAGPSHTLPTGGAGRMFSGLRVTDFLRRTSLVEYTRSSVKKANRSVQAFSKAESLPFHGKSLAIRG